MPFADLPSSAQLDAPSGGNLADLPSGAQLDTPQVAGAWRWPALLGSSVAKGALEGAGAIGDLEDFLGRQVESGIYRPLRKMVTGTSETLADRTPGYVAPGNPLDSSSLVAAGRALGAVDRPDLAPQTAGERFGASAAEGAGGVLPYIPFGGANPVGIARGLTQGAAAGIGGEAGAEALPDHPDLARATGAILGALGAGKIFNAGNRLAGAATGASTPTLDAYRNLGVDPTLAGDVTGSPTLQMFQTYAAKAPGGAGRVHSASGQALDQWGNALEDAAAGVGNSRSLQDAGAALQLEGNNWLNQFKNASRGAWNAVDLQIPAATPVPVTNYARTLNDVRSAMPNAPATAEILQPALSRNLLDSLISDTQNSPLTWQDVRGIRTRIGEKLADPQLVGDTGYADLKRIYGALSNDLQSAAASRGAAAANAFNSASAVTRDGHDFIENVLSPIMQAPPEKAAAGILNSGVNGGTTLQAIRGQMPAAADELAAYKLRDMGLANAGQQDATGARLSPGAFLTDANKLSPEAADALFGADPDLQRRVGDLATVAGSMKGTERFLNTSNTGSHGAAGHAANALIGAPLAALEGYRQAGWPGALAGFAGGTIAPFLPSYAAARLTTSPLLTRLFAAPPAVSPPSGGLLATGAVYPQSRGLLDYDGRQ